MGFNEKRGQTELKHNWRKREKKLDELEKRWMNLKVNTILKKKKQD